MNRARIVAPQPGRVWDRESPGHEATASVQPPTLRGAAVSLVAALRKNGQLNVSTLVDDVFSSNQAGATTGAVDEQQGDRTSRRRLLDALRVMEAAGIVLRDKQTKSLRWVGLSHIRPARPERLERSPPMPISAARRRQETDDGEAPGKVSANDSSDAELDLSEDLLPYTSSPSGKDESQKPAISVDTVRRKRANITAKLSKRKCLKRRISALKAQRKPSPSKQPQGLTCPFILLRGSPDSIVASKDKHALRIISSAPVSMLSETDVAVLLENNAPS